MHDTLVDRLARLAPWWVLLQVACWPWRGVAEAVLSLGALLGFGLMWAMRFRGALRVLSHEAWALTSILFCGYWLPQVLSIPLALDPANTALEAAKDLRYLPFLWLAAMAVSTARGARLVGVGLAALVAVWTLDGLLQAATGYSVGGPAVADRLSGIFGADNLKLGLVLATLSPFALFPAAKRGVLPWLLVAGALGVVILLAGARAAWISFALALAVTGLRHWGWKRTGIGLLAGGLLTVVVASTSDFLGPRVERTLEALEMKEEGVDFALSGRLVLWQTTGRIILDHPLTGVGTDNFQRAYKAYAAPDDQFVEWGRAGAFHAHQIVLEVLAETGIVGLMLWLAAVAIALRAWRFAEPAVRERASAPALALLVTVFPLNTHLAFYSTFWGGVTLLLAALYAGALMRRDAGDPAAA
ncbi:O-antigen ligase family protein [Silanimonas sp.]|jgi:O-antigen ligase|uniref:O-antigen ligase family protein n=1 Tax=Silanimonas sp. TaxID=1929290 RepID=UPI0037CC7BF0